MTARARTRPRRQTSRTPPRRLHRASKNRGKKRRTNWRLRYCHVALILSFPCLQLVGYIVALSDFYWEILLPEVVLTCLSRLAFYIRVWSPDELYSWFDY